MDIGGLHRKGDWNDNCELVPESQDDNSGNRMATKQFLIT